MLTTTTGFTPIPSTSAWPQSYRTQASKLGYKTVEPFVEALQTINDSFKQYGRKSDGKRISYLMLYKLSIDKTSARVLCVRGKDVTINGNLFIFKESDIFFDKDVPVLR